MTNETAKFDGNSYWMSTRQNAASNCTSTNPKLHCIAVVQHRHSETSIPTRVSTGTAIVAVHRSDLW